MSHPLSLRHYHHETIAHSHSHAQLVFGLSGRLEFEVGGRGCLVAAQQLAIVPAAAHHACASRQGSQCLVLDVPGGDWLQQSLGRQADAGQRLLEQAGPRPLDERQQQLVHWLAQGPLDDPALTRQGAALLLASLSQPAEPAASSRAQLPLRELSAYIDRHHAHPLEVGDLARLCGLSPARLHARFLQETGLTPMAFVRQRRLQHAVGLLRHSRLPVGEIAAQVGYSSQSAFTAALSRELGLSPRQIRRELRDKAGE